MRALRRAVHLVSFRPRQFWVGSLAWITYFLYPIIPGVVLARAFTAIEHRGSAVLIGALLVGLFAAELCVRMLLRFGHRTYMEGFEAANALARVNAMDAQLQSGGLDVGPRVLTAGDAMTRLRDDPKDLVMFVDNWVDVIGSTVFAAIAAVVLARTQPWATAVAMTPLLIVVVANRSVGNLIRRYRRASRDATSEVSTFLNATLGAALTIKLAGAQSGVVARLDQMNRHRAHAMVLDQVWSEGMQTVNAATSNICVGLALVVAARSHISTAEISLFASYALNLVWFPVRIGQVMVGRRRFEVSATRMEAMLPPTTATHDYLTHHRAMPVAHGPELEAAPPVDRVPLDRLDVRSLSVAARGLDDVSFAIERGSLTVVTGPVGCGKSSLMRAILGLIAADSGEVCWNDTPVADRAAFFVPPNSAYVAQVPSLFATTIAGNVLLGTGLGTASGSEAEIWEALRLAAFDHDVASFPDGIDTVIGARGMRLSGGQAQRLAAARAFVHRPELLVIDDLSSALDSATEQRLWDEVRGAGFTVLAVSNRPAAIARADQGVNLG